MASYVNGAILPIDGGYLAAWNRSRREGRAVCSQDVPAWKRTWRS